jgi:hypothetical protein
VGQPEGRVRRQAPCPHRPGPGGEHDLGGPVVAGRRLARQLPRARAHEAGRACGGAGRCRGSKPAGSRVPRPTARGAAASGPAWVDVAALATGGGAGTSWSAADPPPGRRQRHPRSGPAW